MAGTQGRVTIGKHALFGNMATGIIDKAFWLMCRGTSGQHSTLDTLGYGDGAYPGRDPLLSVSEATSMVTSWGERAGIIKCGQLYKLIGKTPLDINWKKYWVS